MSITITDEAICEAKQLDQLDAFVENSNNGTIFHKLKFLSYHGNKFGENTRCLIWRKGSQIFGLMHFIETVISNKRMLVSPYGASFGGPIFLRPLKIKEALIVSKSLRSYLHERAINKCMITLAPPVYSIQNCDALSYALEKTNFKIEKRELHSVIDLQHKQYDDAWHCYEGRARTAVRKGRDDFEIFNDVNIEEFYPTLLEDKCRHNSAPTHSLDELMKLKALYPQSVKVDLARHKISGAQAGICYFIPNDRVILTFYMAQQATALGLNGLNVLIDYGIKLSIENGYNYYDFGSSTAGYNVENIGVANFKESFGAFSTSRSTYTWKKDFE